MNTKTENRSKINQNCKTENSNSSNVPKFDAAILKKIGNLAIFASAQHAVRKLLMLWLFQKIGHLSQECLVAPSYSNRSSGGLIKRGEGF